MPQFQNDSVETTTTECGGLPGVRGEKDTVTVKVKSPPEMRGGG
jgi:hypothetical protein